MATIKKVRTPGYNYNWDAATGDFARWGHSLKDDPQVSPLGPELLDIEIATACQGIGKPCAFCYRGNTPKGKDMTLAQFKELLAKFPANVMQIAFGLGDTPSLDGTRGNPDTFAIFAYTRQQGIIPNCTINGWGLDEATARALAEVCGAVSVSRYDPADVCYDAVAKLTRAGLCQTNIHMLVSEERYGECRQVLEDAQSDPRLRDLNAIVFLSAKRKGRGKWLTPLSSDRYRQLVEAAFFMGRRIGFDSCAANKFLDIIKDRHDAALYGMLAEPCESGLFSGYCSVDGVLSPCSFSTDEPDVPSWDLSKVTDFMAEVWQSEAMGQWRERLLSNHRNCPLFEV